MSMTDDDERDFAPPVRVKGRHGLANGSYKSARVTVHSIDQNSGSMVRIVSGDDGKFIGRFEFEADATLELVKGLTANMSLTERVKLAAAITDLDLSQP